MIQTEQQKRGKQSKRRGYSYERTLCDRINKHNFWTAYRLGAPQVHLPDILATYNDTIVAIECKSTLNNICTIPYSQHAMCTTMIQSFLPYTIKYGLIACKFYGRNIEYIYEIPPYINHDLKCNIHGELYHYVDNKRTKVVLDAKTCAMPWAL